ncbi:threonine ammonia-lyase [Streptomyces specialis]|uniref:threonine ammonia-lyase n=1 Tax=Streptomyces specialis TaxID=498367 RepID=UPI00073F7F9F|nr:pyridoxal-phosphate dependent enzyme [Streptomyces specialis]
MPFDISLAAVEEAARVIDPVFRDSPEVTLRPGVVLKLETLNPVRSFKGRGGDWLGRRAAPGEVLVCASAGNLGQGVAYGARRHGRAAHVVAARTANPVKLRRVQRLGAHVHLVDGDFDAAKERAARLAAEHGWRLVEDGREPALAEGAASIAVELARRHGPELRRVLVPVGNGSLACGLGTWLRAVSPDTQVIGIGPAAAPATQRAWSTGELVPGPPFRTIAEGLCARVPVPQAVGVLRAVLDEFVLVGEDRLLTAARALWDSCGVLTEPSGAAAMAALLDHPEYAGDGRDGVTALVITGANATDDLLPRITGAADGG